MKKLLYNDQIAHLKYHGKYYRTVLMKIITIVMVCSIICITVCSCESAFINDEVIDEGNELLIIFCFNRYI